MNETGNSFSGRLGQAQKRVNSAEANLALLQSQLAEGVAAREHPAWHGQMDALLRVRMRELTQARQQLAEVKSRPLWQFD